MPNPFLGNPENRQFLSERTHVKLEPLRHPYNISAFCLVSFQLFVYNSILSMVFFLFLIYFSLIIQNENK